MLLMKSYRRNSISKVELWRNRPFSEELPAFSPQMTSVYPYSWELSLQMASEDSFPLELSPITHILGFPV